ncbi:MAG TPA: MbnP family protein [Chitinophagales bacterium]|nr:MbnP family protein [Chitinophagales bacterium]
MQKRLKVLALLAVTVLIVGLWSCHHDADSTTGTVVLQMSSKYGDQSFALNSFNTDPQGRYLKVQNLAFYLSHIQLVKTDNSVVDLDTVAIFNFDIPATLSVTYKNIPIGEYKKIIYWNGVDSLQNLHDPGDPNLLSPLSGGYDMWWPMLLYRFETMDAKWDTQDTLLRHGLTYHIGTNAIYRSGQVDGNFSVTGGNTTNLNMVLDVKKIFYPDNNDSIDLVNEGQTQCSNASELAIAAHFADNFSQAFSLQ